MVRTDPPTVSVIIPCHNHGRYLREAVDSARAMTGVSTEVIVVDDGSSDDTAEVMRSCERIVAIHQENQGLAAARNAGLKVATGEFVTFLDADDRLAPTFAAESVATCEAFDCDFSFCDFQRIDRSGKVFELHQFRFRWPVAQSIVPLLMRGGFFPPVCVLGRRTAVHLFPAGMDGHADYAMWLDVSLAGARFAHLPRALAFYRTTDTSMSADRMHMELSWQAALAFNANRHPQKFFAAVQALQKEHHAALLLLKPQRLAFVTRHFPRVTRIVRSIPGRLRRQP